VVTATDIVSGEIKDFTNEKISDPITIEHLIASGSLPPSYAPAVIGKHSFWDSGLFDNTPLGSLPFPHPQRRRRADARDRHQPLP